MDSSRSMRREGFAGREEIASVLRLLGALETPSVLFRFRCEAGVVKKEEDMAEVVERKGEAGACKELSKMHRRTFFLTPTPAMREMLGARAPSSELHPLGEREASGRLN